MDHSEVFDKLIGSSKHEVHRLLHIRYQRTQENGPFPFSDILMLISSLQNMEKNANFASPLKIQTLKSFQLQGPPGPCWGSAPKPQLPWIPLLFDPPLFDTFRGLCG